MEKPMLGAASCGASKVSVDQTLERELTLDWADRRLGVRRRHRHRGEAVLLASILCCMGCDSCDDETGAVVETYVNSAADFTAFRTFAISAQPPAEDEAPLPAEVAESLSVVNNAVRSELEDRGLTEVDPAANPSLFVVTLVRTDDQQALTWSCVPGYWWGYTVAWEPCSWLTPLVVDFEVGTVAVGLVDVAHEQASFAGVLRGVLDAGDDLVSDRVVDGVGEMFEDYPTNQTGAAP
jgi:hypothetical protein